MHTPSRSVSCAQYAIGERGGIVLGKLFHNRIDQAAGDPDVTLRNSDAAKIVATRGRYLTERYWGRYVAFITDEEGTHHVLRDPTGAMPCYFLHFDEVTVFFSHIGDCRALLGKALTVNWPHVIAFLHFSRVISAQTGFSEISQNRAGECVSVSRKGTVRTFYWHPARICQADAIEEPSEACAMLQEAVTHSVQRLGSCYGQILIELSGGLDSSIVLMCLARAPRPARITCLNMYTESAAGDERAYARAAAKKAQCEIIETIFSSANKSLEQMLSRASVASPALVALMTPAADLLEQTATANGIQAIVSGRGGDQLFQRRRNSLIAAEYVHRHGFGRNLLKIASDTAKLTEKSFWTVLLASIRHGMLSDTENPYSILRPPRFLSRAAQDIVTAEDLHHPWVRHSTGLPASKRQQIFDVIDTQNYFDFTCRYADIIPPLVSQPIIECVLRIPSYVLTIEGRERSLVRRAFASQVPTEIITRQAKGEVTGFYQDLILENLHYIRSLLLDGILVKERFIDGASLEEALSHGVILKGTELAPVLNLVKAEVWLRSVVSQEQQAVA